MAFDRLVDEAREQLYGTEPPTPSDPGAGGLGHGIGHEPSERANSGTYKSRSEVEKPNHLQEDSGMARPGLEPGTPRFSVVPPRPSSSDDLREIAARSTLSQRPRSRGICVRFSLVTADGEARRPFRRTAWRSRGARAMSPPRLGAAFTTHPDAAMRGDASGDPLRWCTTRTLTGSWRTGGSPKTRRSMSGEATAPNPPGNRLEVEMGPYWDPRTDPQRRNPRKRGDFEGGRYWARTSDLRLVEAALSQLS
jgi:hypothetical protein